MERNNRKMNKKSLTTKTPPKSGDKVAHSKRSELKAKRTESEANYKRSELVTSAEVTWCPGCPNYLILESIKQTITNLINTPSKSGDKVAHSERSELKAKRTISEANYKRSELTQKDFCVTTDIGCHAKIFDYLNLSGIYCLHGRALPTAIGITLGNPNLKVLAFAGDGAVYSEGIAHFIHAFKYNADLTLILHDNQSFSLTTGQPTPTSQKGYISKASPLGTQDKPMNPIKLALASNATFIARTSAKNIKHMTETFTKAITHKGFSFVEVIQDCLIFNLDANNKDKQMYEIEDNTDKPKAEKLADEFDYNSKKGKIPIGIIYQSEESTLTDKWPILKGKLQPK